MKKGFTYAANYIAHLYTSHPEIQLPLQRPLTCTKTIKIALKVTQGVTLPNAILQYTQWVMS